MDFYLSSYTLETGQAARDDAGGCPSQTGSGTTRCICRQDEEHSVSMMSKLALLLGRPVILPFYCLVLFVSSCSVMFCPIKNFQLSEHRNKSALNAQISHQRDVWNTCKLQRLFAEQPASRKMSAERQMSVLSD